MIAYKQSLFHRAGWNHKILRKKGENEQTHHQHRTDTGHRLEGRLFDLFLNHSGRGLCLNPGWRDIFSRHPVARKSVVSE
jgi:hypothetical protein